MVDFERIQRFLGDNLKFSDDEINLLLSKMRENKKGCVVKDGILSLNELAIKSTNSDIASIKKAA